MFFPGCGRATFFSAICDLGGWREEGVFASPPPSPQTAKTKMTVCCIPALPPPQKKSRREMLSKTRKKGQQTLRTESPRATPIQQDARSHNPPHLFHTSQAIICSSHTFSGLGSSFEKIAQYFFSLKAEKDLSFGNEKWALNWFLSSPDFIQPA